MCASLCVCVCPCACVCVPMCACTCLWLYGAAMFIQWKLISCTVFFFPLTEGVGSCFCLLLHVYEGIIDFSIKQNERARARAKVTMRQSEGVKERTCGERWIENSIVIPWVLIRERERERERESTIKNTQLTHTHTHTYMKTLKHFNSYLYSPVYWIAFFSLISSH